MIATPEMIKTYEESTKKAQTIIRLAGLNNVTPDEVVQVLQEGGVRIHKSVLNALAILAAEQKELQAEMVAEAMKKTEEKAEKQAEQPVEVKTKPVEREPEETINPKDLIRHLVNAINQYDAVQIKVEGKPVSCVEISTMITASGQTCAIYLG